MVEIPTSISPRELEVILKYAQGKRVVEFGALLGFSTISMAQVASKVVSIDRHEGYGPPTLNTYLSNLDRYGVKSKVETRIVDVKDSDYVWGQVGFIDLDGTHETTLEAIQKCRTNVILLHDTCRSRCEGVEKAIFTAGGFLVTEHVDSLSVCHGYESRRYHSAMLRKEKW